mmetsp:Transcript_10084/g.18679  ORF Transcript_10084/g.18679 Transcript_10084/m.18679 type:complete len:146 (+) Transcript_10084:120-557(+)
MSHCNERKVSIAGFQPCWYNILQDVQSSFVFNDCKTFVDMPAKKSWVEIEEEWSQLQRPIPLADLKLFIEQNFDAPGSDLEDVIPVDWINIRSISGPLKTLDDSNQLMAASSRIFGETSALKLPSRYLHFALSIYNLWPKLCRRV